MKDFGGSSTVNIMHKKPTHTKQFRAFRYKWYWLTFLFVGLAVLLGYVIWHPIINTNALGLDFQPSTIAAAQQSAGTVPGNLGGIKVKMPRYLVEYVEYNSDPNFGEKRNGVPPVRTTDSILRAFGMDVRYPDMKGLIDRQTREEKRRQPLHESTWLYVVINAGEDYPGDGFLDRRVKGEKGSEFDDAAPELKGHWFYTYRRLPEKIHELDAFILSQTDPRTGKPAQESEDTYDIFIHRQPSGKVDAFIKCGRARPYGVASCSLSSSLEPKAHVQVNVRFRRDMLPNWQSIQNSVHQLLFSFEVKDALAAISSGGALFEQASQQDMSQRAGVIHARMERSSRGQQHRIRGRAGGIFFRGGGVTSSCTRTSRASCHQHAPKC